MKRGLIVISLMVLSMHYSATSQMAPDQQVFVRKISYTANVLDDKTSSQVQAIEQAKRSLLVDVQSYFLHKPATGLDRALAGQITAAGGVLMPVELSDEQWDGKIYQLKATAIVDINFFVAKFEELLKFRQKLREFADLSRQADSRLSENKILLQKFPAADDATRKALRNSYQGNCRLLRYHQLLEDADGLWSFSRASDAITIVDKALELRPGDSWALHTRGLCYEDLGQYNKAVEDFEKAIAGYPAYARAYYSLGVLYSQRMSDTANALNNYALAINLDSTFVRAYINRSIILGDRHQDTSALRRALSDANKLLRYEPENDDIYFQRGTIYYDLWQLEPAIKDYQSTIRLNPKHAWAYYELGCIYNVLNDCTLGIKQYKMAVTLEPDNKDFQQALQNTEENLKAFRQVIQNTNEALKYFPINKHPKSASLYYCRGYNYEGVGEYRKALADMRLAASYGDTMAVKWLRKHKMTTK